MKTKNLIQMQANVCRVTSLKKGDVFKMIDDNNYGDNVYYGVILDLFNTGEKSFVQVLRYQKSYGDVKAELKVYNGDEDISMFPTQIEEVKDYFKQTIESIEEDIAKDKKNLQEKIDALDKAKSFTQGELAKSLSEMSFEEITQEGYEQKKIEKEKEIQRIKGIE